MRPYNTPARRSHGAGKEQPSSQQNPPASQSSARRTPRFLFGPSASQTAGPQFSSTPRFQFGDPSSQTRDDIDLSDDGDDDNHQSSPTRHAGVASHGSKLQPLRSEDDIIMDDSDHSMPDQVVKPRDIFSDCEEDLPSRNIQASRREEQDEDELFPPSPIQPQVKRPRRASPSPTKRNARTLTKASDFDTISSPPTPSSPPHSIPTEDQPHISSQHETEGHDELLTPPHRAVPSTPFQNLGRARIQLFPSTVRSTPFTPDFHPSNTQPRERERPEDAHSQTPIPGSSSTPFTKPRFILPPTPRTADTDKPAGEPAAPNPLSPLSLRSKRPGRPSKSSLKRPDFIAGGMASELRTWLFEIGSRQQASTASISGSHEASQLPSQRIPKFTRGVGNADRENTRTAKYKYREISSVANFRYSNAQHGINDGGAFAGRPAPFTLITAQVDSPGSNGIYDNIILFNPPITHTGATPKSSGAANRAADTCGYGLQRGSKVGVRRRLAWEIEMDPLLASAKNDQGAQELPDSNWLVGTEWDILESDS